jgi:anti-anti-sigma factor
LDCGCKALPSYSADPFAGRNYTVPALNCEERGDVLVVSFTEAKILDETRIQQIGTELMEATKRAVGGKLLLDFQGVQFMSSAMIGKLILMNKKCKADNLNLKLCNISASVMEVFRIMRLNKVLSIHDNQEKGLAAFDKKGWFG